jgi:aspartyl/asparaginyl beta-hydroxylase (cupin superfamily)
MTKEEQQYFLDRLVDNTDNLIKEYCLNENIKKTSIPDWSEDPIPSQEWQSVGLWWNYKPRKLYQKHFPLTTSLVEIGPTHKATGHLLLKPNSSTPKHNHKDWGNKVILHLPLIIPEGDVGFWIDGNIYRWTVGKLFSFNITKDHQGFNNTDKNRVLLVMDFDSEIWGETLRKYMALEE